jgi:hypothetical protein
MLATTRENLGPPMPAQYVPALAFLFGALVALVASSLSVSLGGQLQQEILKRGAVAHGRILRIWRPPLFGAFTRVYFEFHPTDAPASVQTCHVDRRTGESTASLPAVGTVVRVKYLPERPSRAVIAKLVSRFID